MATSPARASSPRPRTSKHPARPPRASSPVPWLVGGAAVLSVGALAWRQRRLNATHAGALPPLTPAPLVHVLPPGTQWAAGVDPDGQLAGWTAQQALDYPRPRPGTPLGDALVWLPFPDGASDPVVATGTAPGFEVGAFDRLAYDVGVRDGYLLQGAQPMARHDLLLPHAVWPDWTQPEARDTRPGMRDTEAGRAAYLDLIGGEVRLPEHVSAAASALVHRIAADPRTRTFYAQGFVDGQVVARSRAGAPTTAEDYATMRQGLRDGDAAQTALHAQGSHGVAAPPPFDGSLGGLFYHRGWHDGVEIRQAYDGQAGHPGTLGLQAYYLLIGNPSLSFALHPVLWPPGYGAARGTP